MASVNSREALGIRNAFSHENIERVRGFEHKSDSENYFQAYAIINGVVLCT